MDTYRSFAELAAAETEGEDFVVQARPGKSIFAVIAIHGGGIEPGTAELAEAVAGGDHALYTFRGIKPYGNARLHITSSRFDEPRCLAMVGGAGIVLSLHGRRGRHPFVQLGGRHEALRSALAQAFSRSGFDAVPAVRPTLNGMARGNVCNRCRSGKGVQLEISEGLRQQCYNRLTAGEGRRKTLFFDRFVETVRTVLGEPRWA